MSDMVAAEPTVEAWIGNSAEEDNLVVGGHNPSDHNLEE